MPVGPTCHPPIAPGVNGDPMDGPILIKGVANPEEVYAIPSLSAPIVAVGPKYIDCTSA
jgi:hypothetical protein